MIDKEQWFFVEGKMNSLIRQKPFERMLTLHIEEKDRAVERAKTEEINRHFKKHLSTMHAWAVDNLSLDHVLTPEEYADLLPHAYEWQNEHLKKGMKGVGIWGICTLAGFFLSAVVSPVLFVLWGAACITQVGCGLFFIAVRPSCRITNMFERYFTKPISFLRYGHYGNHTGKISLPYSNEEKNTLRERYVRLFIRRESENSVPRAQ
ncbi:MAG: hypothetical protein HYZ69_01510 [Candidatus Colwellbacteria bacterium]|nr:hypothetical protein [Candidatus Colwellbacteria bacterium]